MDDMLNITPVRCEVRWEVRWEACEAYLAELDGPFGACVRCGWPAHEHPAHESPAHEHVHELPLAS
jgi:hypothetical protein